MANFFRWVISIIGAILAVGVIAATMAFSALASAIGFVILIIGAIALGIRSLFNDKDKQ
jgi:hypothetical protein